MSNADRPTSMDHAQFSQHVVDAVSRESDRSATGGDDSKDITARDRHYGLGRMLNMAFVLTRPPRCVETPRSTGKAAVSEEVIRTPRRTLSL